MTDNTTPAPATARSIPEQSAAGSHDPLGRFIAEWLAGQLTERVTERLTEPFAVRVDERLDQIRECLNDGLDQVNQHIDARLDELAEVLARHAPDPDRAATDATPAPSARPRVEVIAYSRHCSSEVDLLGVFIDGVEHTVDVWHRADLTDDPDSSDAEEACRALCEEAADCTPGAADAIAHLVSKYLGGRQV